MIGIRTVAVIAGCVATGLTVTGGEALAADAEPDMRPPEIRISDEGAAEASAPEVSVREVNVKEAKGWYVRGDAGYAVGTVHQAPRVRAYDPASGDYDSSSFDDNRFGGSDFTGDIGVGYQFNDLIRADVTGDLFGGDFDGRLAGATACAGGAAGTGCSTKASSSFTAGSLMLNGYVDLGTVAGFTPYLGAGIGATRVDWGHVDATSSCVAGAIGCGGGGGGSVRYPGESDWRMTYALMAGVSYDIAQNVKFDLGYRYSHVAGGDMFSSSAADGTSGATGHDGGLARHEIRVGLRITTW